MSQSVGTQLETYYTTRYLFHYLKKRKTYFPADFSKRKYAIFYEKDGTMAKHDETNARPGDEQKWNW